MMIIKSLTFIIKEQILEEEQVMVLSTKIITLLFCLSTCENIGFRHSEQFPFKAMQTFSLIDS
jgi:hypothetical protein